MYAVSISEHLLLRSQSMTFKDRKKKQEQMHRDLAVNTRRNPDGDGLRRRIHPPLFIYARQVSSDSHKTDWGFFPKEIDTENYCTDNIVQARILDIEEKVHITSLATSEEESKFSENKVRGATSDNEDNFTNENDVSILPPHAMSSLVSASEASGSFTSSLIKLYAPLLPSIMGDDVSDYTDDIIIEDMMMMSEEPVRPQRHYWSQSWSKTTANEKTSRVSSRLGACEVGSILIGASAASAVGATIVGAFVTGALVVGFSVMGASALVVCIVKAGHTTRA